MAVRPAPALDPPEGFPALVAANRLAEAEALLQAALARKPADAALRYFFAEVRFRMSRFDEARSLLAALVADEPGLARARYLLADAERMLGALGEAASGYTEALVVEFSLDGGADVESRLAAILEWVASAPIPQLASRQQALRAVGAALEKSGHVLGDAVLERMGGSALVRATGAEFGNRIAAAALLLAANAGSSPAWMQRLFEGVLLAWMRGAIAAGRFDNALEIENIIYATFVRQTETEEHFRNCFSRWVDDMRAAGKRAAAGLALPPAKPPGARPRVAFFVHNVTPLAHVTTLLEVLAGHAELPEPLMEPYLFYISGDPATVERFTRVGVRAERLAGGQAQEGLHAPLVRLRSRVAEEGIAALAWISLATAMAFAFSMRVAPRQVWWAMKYHALEFPEIDDYLTGGGDTGVAMLHGRAWRVGPVVAGQWFAPELGAEAARIRQSLAPRGTVFGCFGREEKLSDPAFLDAVAEILRACPEAMFLWTGRTKSASIQQRLELAGVAARCHFIGWVNTKLYAQVIDVFLDSFPFPCGFTLYEAMAAGKPAVLYDARESSHGGINAIAGPLLAADPGSSGEARLAHAIFRPDAGPQLYLRAATPGEYAGHAIALARDEAFRRRAGAAHREFIEKLMTDKRRAARIYVDHLLGRDPAAATPAA